LNQYLYKEMKNNYLPYYVFERLNSIKQHLKAYSEDREEKRLHSLRLDIKKLNAIYVFLDKTYEENFHAPDLKKLFKSAGAIRERYIHIKTMQTMIGFPEKFVLQLKKEALQLEDQFIKQIPVHLHVIDHLNKVLLLPVALPSKKVIQQYFKKEEKKITTLFQKKARHKMHDCRIRIKQVLYAYFALPEKLQDDISINRRELLKQEAKIGDWHNTLATVRFLSKHELDEKLQLYLNKLKKQEKSEFKFLSQTIF